jgi:hypothetical protein
MKLTNSQIRRLQSLRADCHDSMDGELAICDIIAHEIEEQFGWKMQCGKYAPDEFLEYHCWNLLPDGELLDASADQFGDREYWHNHTGICIMTPGTDEFAFYQNIPAYLGKVVLV